MGLQIFPNNDVGHDPNGLRTLRLLALKTYIEVWAVILSLPPAMVDWALAAYDRWVAALGNSTVQMGESEEAYQDMQEADGITFNYYLKCKELLLDLYGLIDRVLKIYGIEGAFPKARKDRLRTVQDLLDGHAVLKVEGDPNVLPDAFIEKLQGFLDASNVAFANYVVKEKPEALAAVDAQNTLKDADTKELRTLYSWTQMTWEPTEPFLIQLGFAPAVPQPGSGQPGEPQDVEQDYQDPELDTSWSPCDNATSYQLAFSENNSDWEELYFGDDTSFRYNPPDGLRYYKVRARNKHGYSDWSETLEFTPPEVPE
ncbi:MAG: fibronectin type III domain-containing protein [Candidatus Cloacimonetes bacterium]|nr:fibronectin type III domain-containing protein [Candidatus Cloacimonadota bacterium]